MGMVLFYLIIPTNPMFLFLRALLTGGCPMIKLKWMFGRPRVICVGKDAFCGLSSVAANAGSEPWNKRGVFFSLLTMIIQPTSSWLFRERILNPPLLVNGFLSKLMTRGLFQ